MSLVALLLAWVYIFDTVQRERELLEGPKEGIVGAQGLQDPSEVAHTTTVFPPDKIDSSKGKDEETGEMSGQAVTIPPQMIVDSADGRGIGDMYAPMQGNFAIPEANDVLEDVSSHISSAFDPHKKQRTVPECCDRPVCCLLCSKAQLYSSN